MRTLDLELEPERVFEALRRPGAPALFFDGRGGHDGSWPCRVGVNPRASLRFRALSGESSRAVRPLDELVASRRATGGAGGTGVALLCGYEAFTPGPRAGATSWDVVALEVDASVAFSPHAPPLLVSRGGKVDGAIADLVQARSPGVPPPAAPCISGCPRTSLGREAYIRAVARVKDHIARGDVYQANLTQTFDAAFEGDPWTLYRALAAATPAPRSAYVELSGWALASVSPEVFVDATASGLAETRPIKGTRPRGATPAADEAAAAELCASPKDRAELVMIVDVLRNDLGRVARLGSVAVPELWTLRSYAAVHHLVARVTAELADDATPGAILEAVAPGGSITGAPKKRAVELLRELEPCPRGFYTGSLFWFDDDGSMASSILIRSAVVHGGRVTVGAGGGVVADSDPEAEWSEANAKARALTRVLGFDPEEAA